MSQLKWKATWASEMIHYENQQQTFENTTQHLLIKNNLAGNKVRLLLSNKFGTAPLVIDKIYFSTTENSKRYFTKIITKNQEVQIIVPPQTEFFTDELDYEVAVGETLLLSLSIKEQQTLNTLGTTIDTSLFTSFFDSSLPTPAFFLGICQVDILTENHSKTISFFGDSLTHQGFMSSAIATQLYKQYPGKISVCNAGISGNRLLHTTNSTSRYATTFGVAGLDRFQDDLFNDHSTDIIFFLEGTNDLVHPGNGSPLTELPTSQDLIDGIKKVQIIAEKQDCLLIICTLPPFKGYTNEGNLVWNSKIETTRQEVNQWILQQENVIDVDKLVASHTQPTHLAQKADCGDHLHFNQYAGQLIAESIDWSNWI
ncbi:GDSL-type esterase/lipase family protein [Carnobacterium gallinarum]|uniref:GDSL-type esterase/lipase family protein n=1 Tax=Carnobacterium gallinarum TaxID=2749 RepID=UPI0005524416|nr:GDSL-type esterase/lipase family protein [Carnobacterium gallinarum]